MVLTLLNLAKGQRCDYFLNGGFDSVYVGATVGLVTGTQMPVWQTTATDCKFEVWANGYNGINSYSGIQFVEMNATMPATLFQTVTATPGTTLSISFAHRGRGGIDSISVSAGPVGGPYTTLNKYGNSQSAWITYTVNYIVPNLGNSYSIRFNSIYWAAGNPAVGNLLDAVKVCGTAPNTTGLTKIDNSFLSLAFPNPSNSEIKILESNPNNENRQLTVYNNLGKEILTVEKNANDSFTINKNEVGTGLFIYKIKSISNSHTGKFIFTD